MRPHMGDSPIPQMDRFPFQTALCSLVFTPVLSYSFRGGLSSNVGSHRSFSQ